MSEHIVGVEPKVYNGKKYRSTLEARIAEILDSIGLFWEYETKKIILQEGFYCPYQKEKVRNVEYIPDFIIGPIMIEVKGYETPDWKIKKKMLYRYFVEKEPHAIFYIVKNEKQLLQALDNHWSNLGFCIEVISKKETKVKGKKVYSSCFRDTYDSIKQAMFNLKLEGKAIGPILKSLSGKKDYIYGYSWKLKQINI